MNSNQKVTPKKLSKGTETHLDINSIVTFLGHTHVLVQCIHLDDMAAVLQLNKSVERHTSYEYHFIQVVSVRQEYAVKVQRSLAPLSRFRGSHIPSAHEQHCCRFQSFANSVRSPMKFTSEIDIA